MSNLRRAGFGEAVGILSETVSAVWHDELVYLAFYNLLWFVCCLPLFTIPPSTAALYFVTREVTHHRHPGWRDYLQILREHFAVGWRWGMLNLLVVIIVSANLWFYGAIGTTWSMMLSALSWGVFWVWCIVQMYCFPILLEQESPSVRLALRNALVLCLRHPGFTLTLAFVIALLVFLTSMFPVLFALFTVSLMTFVYNRAVRYLIQL